MAIFDINQELGEKVAAEFQSKQLKVTYHNVDVADKDQCVAGVKAAVEANGGQLHYLLNGAAYFGCKGLDATKSDWDKTLSVNVVGYSNMVQSCHPYMKATPGDKSIVNISSAAAFVAQPGRWTYNASKGAVISMTRCIALDFAKDSIRVNTISPGWVWTPEVDKVAYGGREKWDPIWGAHHMTGRVSKASEIASAVCYLLSEDASFVTGSDMQVDGGYRSMGPEGRGEKSVWAGSDY